MQKKIENNPVTLGFLKSVVLEYAELNGWQKGELRFCFSVEKNDVTVYYGIREKGKDHDSVITTEHRLH